MMKIAIILLALSVASCQSTDSTKIAVEYLALQRDYSILVELVNAQQALTDAILDEAEKNPECWRQSSELTSQVRILDAKMSALRAEYGD